MCQVLHQQEVKSQRQHCNDVTAPGDPTYFNINEGSLEKFSSFA